MQAPHCAIHDAIHSSWKWWPWLQLGLDVSLLEFKQMAQSHTASPSVLATTSRNRLTMLARSPQFAYKRLIAYKRSMYLAEKYMVS